MINQLIFLHLIIFLTLTLQTPPAVRQPARTVRVGLRRVRQKRQRAGAPPSRGLGGAALYWPATSQPVANAARARGGGAIGQAAAVSVVRWIIFFALSFCFPFFFMFISFADHQPPD